MTNRIKWHTEKREVRQLVPYKHNPRKLTEEQREQLTKSIEKFDLAEIPAINTDGTIIAGHQRVSILNALGRGSEEIDVRVPNRPLTEDELKEYNLRSNKNSGEWDFDVLLAEFDIDMLKDVGFSAEELPDLSEKPEMDGEDDVPETRKTDIKLGDIFHLGEHRIVCGDSTDPNVYSKIFGDSRANLLLTDPPYNVDYEGGTKEKLKIKNDKMGDSDFREFLRKFCEASFQVMNDGASFYIFHADLEGYNFRGAVQDVGEKIRQCLIWVKNSLVIGRQDYQWRHEPCLYGWKGGDSHLWKSDRKQTTVLEFDRPSRSTEHPTMKPVALFEYLMSNSSNIGDIVLDPFLGSGTTLIAAEKLKRKCYGIEIDPVYCQAIIDRWEKLTGNKAKKINKASEDDIRDMEDMQAFEDRISPTTKEDIDNG